jgi:hypothetical protein
MNDKPRGRTRAVLPDGRPSRERDKDGVLLDLSARDVELLADAGYDPAAYLEERRAEIDALAEKSREADDRKRFEERFVEAGGKRDDARAAYDALKRERAEEAARRADREAVVASRARIRGAV